MVLILKYAIYDNFNLPLFLEGFKTFLLIIGLICIIPVTIYLHNKSLKKSKEKQEEIEISKSEKLVIQKLLEKNIDSENSEKLKEFIKEIKKVFFWGDGSKQIKEKLVYAKTQLKIALQKESLHEIYQEKDELKQEINELKKIKQKKEQELRTKKEDILEHLDIDENNVFLMEDLTKKEIEALKEEGFKKINEYDPILQENSNFLVKQVLNHHLTHTLLVERTKKMLLQYLEYNEVKIHDTRDADITFKVGNKKYAFEIETGNLLGKKVQLREKVEELNRRYKKNWYFIVSNQNLLTKYRKYGKSTPRSGVRRIVEKIVDI